MNYILPKDTGIEIKVRIHPNAKKSSFAGLWNQTHIKININAPAVDGKANEALIAFLAKYLHIRKSAIQLLSGETAREKRLQILDITVDEFLEKAGPFTDTM